MWISITGQAAPTGTLYDGDKLAGDRQATDAEVIAWRATNAPPVQLSYLAFIGLFTPQEQAAIVGSTDVNVEGFLLQAAGADYIDLADPRTIGGMGYLVSVGLLTQARSTAILAYKP